MRKIGVVTVGRSDYGLYLPVLKKIAQNPSMELLLYVTGSHLSPKFGDTYKEILKDGFEIASRVNIDLGSDKPSAISKAMGDCMIGFSKVFEKKTPEILLVLGDRYEMHAVSVSAIPFNIPIAHIHGGEITYGAMDEYFRHSLTKISHLHFASTDIYANRILQMGEEPWRVFVTGAPGIDNIKTQNKLSRKELENKYHINFDKPVFLITFHPVTLEYEKTGEYIANLLGAVSRFNEFNIVFTYPNSDTFSQVIIEKIEEFAFLRPNCFVVKNFGSIGYLSMMGEAICMIGNSSSGIIEAASFALPVVNIGTRQDGRVRGKNVIDVDYSEGNIYDAIKKAVSPAFKKTLENLRNPYGDGNAAEKIVKVLGDIDTNKLLRKKFIDI